MVVLIYLRLLEECVWNSRCPHWDSVWITMLNLHTIFSNLVPLFLTDKFIPGQTQATLKFLTTHSIPASSLRMASVLTSTNLRLHPTLKSWFIQPRIPIYVAENSVLSIDLFLHRFPNSNNLIFDLFCSNIETPSSADLSYQIPLMVISKSTTEIG